MVILWSMPCVVSTLTRSAGDGNHKAEVSELFDTVEEVAAGLFEKPDQLLAAGLFWEELATLVGALASKVLTS